MNTFTKKRMIIHKNISLKSYNTFGLDYNAACIIRIKSEKEARSLFRHNISWKKPLLILGSGSNILFTENYRGTILVPDIKGIKIIRVEGDEGFKVIISAGADVKWDKLVEWCVTRGLYGLENLSLIPGTAGASAVQNIGAYGVEVKDYIVKVKCLSVKDGSQRIFQNDECEFGYRSSIFKNKFKGKYLVTRVYFQLSFDPKLNLSYGSLKDEVKKLGEESLKNVREAVINIRQSKLPDPAIIGNAGSFFKNPVVSKLAADEIIKKYPDVPVYKDNSGLIKLAAGWLVEQCGWKGKRICDAGVHEKQALVLINHGNATGKELYELSEKIKKSVIESFGIALEREVEVIGAI